MHLYTELTNAELTLNSWGSISPTQSERAGDTHDEEDEDYSSGLDTWEDGLDDLLGFNEQGGDE